jgi:hypothetical protein
MCAVSCGIDAAIKLKALGTLKAQPGRPLLPTSHTHKGHCQAVKALRNLHIKTHSAAQHSTTRRSMAASISKQHQGIWQGRAGRGPSSCPQPSHLAGQGRTGPKQLPTTVTSGREGQDGAQAAAHNRHIPELTYLVAGDAHICFVGCIHLISKLCLEIRAGAPEGRAEGVLSSGSSTAGTQPMVLHTDTSRQRNVWTAAHHFCPSSTARGPPWSP